MNDHEEWVVLVQVNVDDQEPSEYVVGRHRTHITAATAAAAAAGEVNAHLQVSGCSDVKTSMVGAEGRFVTGTTPRHDQAHDNCDNNQC